MTKHDESNEIQSDFFGTPPTSELGTKNDTSNNDDLQSNTDDGIEDKITTILPTSSDDEINNMDLAIAHSEYFSLSSTHDKNITIDKVMNLKPTVVYDDLKRFRNRLLQECDSLTQYHLSKETPNEANEKLNRAQCIYAIKNFCAQKNVSLDDGYFSIKSHFQLLLEVTQARDDMKKCDGPSQQQNCQTHKHTKNTAQSKSTKGRNATPRELAENMNGVNMSEFDTYKEQPVLDIRGPAKSLSDNEDTENGHNVATTERTLQTLHAKLETGETNINIPVWIKKTDYSDEERGSYGFDSSHT